MAVYAPEFNKTPIENLLGLVNNENNKGYVPADVNCKAPVTVAATAGGNTTMVEIDLLNLPSEVDGDFVEFYYTRMDLGQLFSLVDAAGKTKFREVDIPLDGAGFPQDVQAFRDEVLRKYGFLVTPEDYDVTSVSHGVVKIAAKADNLAYVGEFTMGVIDSLATRVINTTLAGFTNENSTLYVPA